MKKKKLHPTLNLIKLNCITCSTSYIHYSTLVEDSRIDVCSNCNAFYSGASESEAKVGAVEKYRKRNQIIEKNKV